MSSRDTLVTCPCCQSRLDVDLRTGKVLKWSRATELDETGKPKVREEDWEQATSRVEGRLGSAADKFDASLDREKKRASDLDALFEKAKEKLKRNEPDG
ncbi:MAG TPA: hypothetical protein ENK43_13445 [Planctomycetes bacterium]|nr:hypothetical protein [Planctomycetota bacterium]